MPRISFRGFLKACWIFRYDRFQNDFFLFLSFLAQHIQKLKEENKAKEDTISRLQTKTQKVSP